MIRALMNDARNGHKANSDGAIRRYKSKRIGHSANKTIPESQEYIMASHALYGGTVEMNGKKRFMTSTMAQYMDDTGMGTIRGDMRPFEPQFPVKSYKK